MRRLWALLYYIFAKTPTVKVMISDEYTFVRSQFNVMVPS